MTVRNCVLVFGAMFLLCVAVGPVSGQTPIPIPVADIESPDYTEPPYDYGQIYKAEDWPDMLPWNVRQGALTDVARLSDFLPLYNVNMTGHGDQVAYLYCGDADAGNRPYWYQDLSTTFVAGNKYTLNLQALVTSAGANSYATVGQTLEMTLGYWGENAIAGDGPTIIAQRLIGSTEISNSWADYSLTTGAVSGDAVGKPIVVYISQGNNPYVTGMPYYFDNVSLTTIPEPGTLVLLASGLVGLLAYAWRKRK